MKAIDTLQKQIGESLESRTWRSFADAYRTVYSYVNSDLRQYGLTPPQYSVMRSIGASSTGELTMSEIGKQMIVTYANVTTVVDNLEKLGYARRTRDAQDRRRIRVGLTPAGYKIFEKIHSAHVRQIEGLMEALDERELRKLMRYAEKIRKKAAV